ncbi:MAG: hypothetical protein LH603_00390 [Pseudonocardia sp.]|nr:hypothetical protein [Pseudonocardia sp.]
MTSRTLPVATVVLGASLLVGVTVAGTTAGRPVAGSPPEGAPVAVAAAGPGPAVVDLSADSLVHRHGITVRDQLQKHYQAINRRDYAAWRETVVAERSEDQPEVAWREAYASTTDGTIRVDRIDDAPDGGLLLRVRFVSTQARSDAPAAFPAERLCWYTSLPMTPPGKDAPPRLASTGGGSSRPEVC